MSQKRKSSLSLYAIVLVVILVFSSCAAFAEAESSPDPIRIAFLYSLSGSNAESGQMCLDGASLAVEHVNANGGIKSLGGAPLELVVFDATSDPAQAKNVAERALSDDTIVAGVGAGTSAITLPMLPAFERAQVPVVTFTNAADLTNQGYQYIFSTTNRGTDLGLYQANFIGYLNEEKGANIKRVAIIYENSANGISMADGAREKAEELGLEIVFDESYPAGHADFAPMVTAMKNSGADAVMPYGYMQEARLIFTAMRDLDFYPVVMGNSNWPSYYEALGDATNGVIAVGNWNFATTQVNDNPEFQAIVDEFEEKYGYFMTEQSGPAYDGIKIIAEALEICGSTDPTVLRDTIAENEFEGMQLVGNYKFNEKGENVNGVPAVTQWQYGKPVCVYPVEYSLNEYMDPSEF
ncbi:MAG TPA: ABC transporter substrate-binding protein [Candidatus Pullichristensenella stercorigallinarum]|uniref:ABC transporter substrate-binding protein n=1 Tax=Candidatus Pullichristensenella stercorigallinarum TaxID=2840909 RepID=A0A9D1CWH3_9FIRM|nr:ABC transporter substrate-binding protein [Candidatus Pullichristensenella stercorigallinarum]